MLLKFDVAISRSVDAAHLYWPSGAAARDESSLGGNLSYRDFRGQTWNQAIRTLAEEEQVIGELLSSSPEEFDANVFQMMDALYDDDRDLFGLDVGVASTVIALSAAKCLPFASCNGGALGDHHHECYPLVAFYTKPHNLPPLIAAAEEAEVGLEHDEGAIVAFANDLMRMLQFAKSLIARRKQFSQSPNRTRPAAAKSIRPKD